MAELFWTELAQSASRRNLRLFVTVQGVPYVFHQSADYVPIASILGSGYTELDNAVKIEQGESRLDLVRRRQIGGSLSVVLQEDSSSSLASLFSPRSYRKTWVTAEASDSTTSISVDNTANAPTSPVYIGMETVSFSGTSGTIAYTGCTRGAFGSEAQRHLGDANNGAGVFSAPPQWAGRRVTLHAYLDPGVTSTYEADWYQKIGVFRLEESPAYLGRGQWELRCSELSDEIAQRIVGLGIDDVVVDDQLGYWNPSTSEFEVTLPDSALHMFAAGQDSFVYYNGSTHTKVPMPVAGVTGNTLRLSTNDAPVRATMGDGRAVLTGELRPMTLLKTGTPGERLAALLVSRLGDASNGAYDVLAGTEVADFGGKNIRVGAGILAAEVDFTSIEEVAAFSGGWSYPIVEEEPLERVLDDFTLHTRSMWMIDRDGLLTLKPLWARRETSVMTINDSVLAAGEAVQVELTEEDIFPRVQVRCDYEVINRRFLKEINVTDHELSQRYPYRGDTLTVSSKSLVTSVGARHLHGRVLMPSAQAEDMARRIQAFPGRANLILRMRCAAPALRLYIGDRVSLTLDDVPDFEGGTLGAGTPGRVIATKPDWSTGTVELTIQVVEAPAVIAPACLITSAVAAGTNIVLATTGYEHSSGSTPTDMFGVGWQVYLLDVSTGALESILIASINRATDTIVSTNPIAGTYVAGDVLIMGDAASNITSVVDSYNLYYPADFTYQVPDDTGAADLLTRWR